MKHPEVEYTFDGVKEWVRKQKKYEAPDPANRWLRDNGVIGQALQILLKLVGLVNIFDLSVNNNASTWKDISVL